MNRPQTEDERIQNSATQNILNEKLPKKFDHRQLLPYLRLLISGATRDLTVPKQVNALKKNATPYISIQCYTFKLFLDNEVRKKILFLNFSTGSIQESYKNATSHYLKDLHASSCYSLKQNLRLHGLSASDVPDHERKPVQITACRQDSAKLQ
jgi:hypothetical protein